MKLGTQEIASDVLVIGGGHSAMRAAIEAARQGAQVLLVDKGNLGRSSIATSDPGASFGSIRIPPELGGDPAVPEDAVARDAVEAGGYLNRQEMVQVFCSEAIDRFNDLVGWGVEFRKRPDGKYPGRRNMGESYPYGFGLIGGPEPVFDSMLREAGRLGVSSLGNVMVTRLLTRDGRVVGAFGLDRRWGNYLVFKSKATVVAAGGMTGLMKHTSAFIPCTGDSFALAYEAGAQLGNMEICGFSLIPTPFGISISNGATMPLTAGGGRWYNALGERIMEKYDPERLELAAEWKMPYANLKERRDGRGPVYLDMSFMKPPLMTVVRRVRSFVDVDPLRERVEWSVSLRTSPGGIWIDEWGATTVPGLFAAGDAAGEAGSRGAGGRTGGITSAHVFGRRAGLRASETAKDVEPLDPSQDQVAGEEARLEYYKGREGRNPLDVERKLREFTHENINAIRNQQGLAQAVSYLVGLRHEGIREMGAASLPQLVKAIEVGNLAVTGEMVARAALLRTESRGFHQREDFPRRDDSEWLKWILVEKRSDGEMQISTRPIPIHRYSFKPASR